MSEELQQKLRSQLWTVANTLRGNMSASDFMYFTLGFIFYKYLSEKIELYANEILEEDHITFKEVWNGKDEELKQDVKEECIQNLGYFIEPEYLLHHHRANQQERKYLAVFRTFTQKNRRFYNRTG